MSSPPKSPWQPQLAFLRSLLGRAEWYLIPSRSHYSEQGLDSLRGQCGPGCTCPQAVDESPIIFHQDQGLWYLLSTHLWPARHLLWVKSASSVPFFWETLVKDNQWVPMGPQLLLAVAGEERMGSSGEADNGHQGAPPVPCSLCTGIFNPGVSEINVNPEAYLPQTSGPALASSIPAERS